MKNINTLMISFLCLLAGLFQADVVLGGGLVSEEIFVGDAKDVIQVNTYSIDLMTLTNVKVKDTDTGNVFWLKDHEKAAYLYNSQDVYLWLATDDEVVSHPQNNSILKTENGTAIINVETGILNYTPKAGAVGNDVIYYKIQCNTCEDDAQKTIVLSFSTGQKTNSNLQSMDLQVANYPNPFVEHTIIQYSLSQAGNTNIQLYNTAGTFLKTLKTNEYEKAGIYSFELGAKDLPNGVYYITIQSGEQKTTQEILKL